MFFLGLVPKVLTCPSCGQYIKDLTLDESFELLVAEVLAAKVAAARTEGYDVYDSELFPGLTFQVKCAKPGEGRTTRSVIDGRDCVFEGSPTWTWFEPVAGGADMYIIFGVVETQVYPFVVPRCLWFDESYDSGSGGRILRISTDQYSRCGRYASSFKRNKLWKYHVPTWPRGLLDLIDYYTKKPQFEQPALCGSIAPYSTGG
jgi:hypothetical protein